MLRGMESGSERPGPGSAAACTVYGGEIGTQMGTQGHGRNRATVLGDGEGRAVGDARDHMRGRRCSSIATKLSTDGEETSRPPESLESVPLRREQTVRRPACSCRTAFQPTTGAKDDIRAGKLHA